MVSLLRASEALRASICLYLDYAYDDIVSMVFSYLLE